MSFRLVATFTTAVALAAGIAMTPAGAAPVPGLDRAQFADTVSAGTMKQETFDSLDVGPMPNTPELSFWSDGGTVLVTNGFRSSTGKQSLGVGALEYFLPYQTLTISFGTAVTAFGIDINTWSTEAGSFTATTDTGESFGSLFAPFANRDTGQFLGFTSDTPFTSVTLAGNGNYKYTVDTLDYGKKDPDPVIVDPEPAPVPLPASAWLFAAGVAGLISVRKRAA